MMQLALLAAAGTTTALAVYLAATSRHAALDRIERYITMPAARQKGNDWAAWRDVLVEALAPQLERFLPGTYLQSLRARLRRAGFYAPAHFQIFLVLQVGLALLLAAVGLSVGGPRAMLLAGAGAAIGILLPMVVVGQLGAARQQAIDAALPDSIDLLTACAEAGLGLDAAIGHLTKRRSRASWAVDREFERYLQELHMGVPRQEALRNLANRCQVEDMRHLVNALAQGDALGVGISQLLRGQSQHLRLRRKLRAEERAMKAPIKIIFPLLIGVFPSVFVVILGPAVIKVLDSFAGH
jgi:tight adherence protein C